MESLLLLLFLLVWQQEVMVGQDSVEGLVSEFLTSVFILVSDQDIQRNNTQPEILRKIQVKEWDNYGDPENYR